MASDAPTRLRSIDRLRGLVMVLMAIDHVRDFLGPDVPFRDIDVAAVGAPLFLTRFVTHVCAPVFVVLAGVAAGLQLDAGRSVPELRRFLLTRGAFLVLLELTLVRFAWTFDLTYGSTFLGVIWALGVSMILLAAVVSLPRPIVFAVGLAGVLTHDLLDPVRADALGWFGPIFAILHEPHAYDLARGFRVFFLYPIVPWVFVMALGFGASSTFRLPPRARDARLLAFGASALALFAIVRGALNVYADPTPWPSDAHGVTRVLEMLDCTKYPPSLAYLAITLGPAAFALVALEKLPELPGAPLEWLGRAPLFYYVAHLYLAHGGALLVYYAVYGERALGFTAETRPRFSLGVVYLATFVLVVALAPLCRWFGDLKRRRRDLTILSYF